MSSSTLVVSPDPRERQDFSFRRMRFLRLFQGKELKEEQAGGPGQLRPPRQRIAAASKFGKLFAGKCSTVET